jgi:hypothetical protein
LIRLIADIDQQIAEANSLAFDKSLSDGNRRTASGWLKYHWRIIRRVEAMLGVS